MSERMEAEKQSLVGEALVPIFVIIWSIKIKCLSNHILVCKTKMKDGFYK